jgi:hypothetical protein
VGASRRWTLPGVSAMPRVIYQNQALIREKVKAIAKQVMKPKKTHNFRTRITLTPCSLSYGVKSARRATHETVLIQFLEISRPNRDPRAASAIKFGVKVKV